MLMLPPSFSQRRSGEDTVEKNRGSVLGVDAVKETRDFVFGEDAVLRGIWAS